MTTTWQNILELQRSINTHKEALNQPSYMPLPQMGVLQVSGDDAQIFLQNLLTNDVNSLANTQSQLSGFCNAKGRLLAVFLLIRNEQSYSLILPKTMCASLLQRLSMFVLRSKVSITDQSDNIACIGLKQLELETPELTSYSTSAYRLQQRAIALIPLSQSQHFLTLAADNKWSLASEKSWALLDIKAGLPMVYMDSKEKFTPQQINLDLVDGVSFSKGCYPGQEVVARLHYLGKPSRRLFQAQMTENDCPNSGDEVFTSENNVAGHIVCAQIQEDSVQLLLSLKLTEIDSDLSINGKTVSLIKS